MYSGVEKNFVDIGANIVTSRDVTTPDLEVSDAGCLMVERTFNVLFETWRPNNWLHSRFCHRFHAFIY